jgi:hypothetical protein
MKPGIAQIKATVASACCHHSIFVLKRREENVTFTFNNLSQETTQKLLPQSLSFFQNFLQLPSCCGDKT